MCRRTEKLELKVIGNKADREKEECGWKDYELVIAVEMKEQLSIKEVQNRYAPEQIGYGIGRCFEKSVAPPQA